MIRDNKASRWESTKIQNQHSGGWKSIQRQDPKRVVSEGKEKRWVILPVDIHQNILAFLQGDSVGINLSILEQLEAGLSFGQLPFLRCTPADNILQGHKGSRAHRQWSKH